MPLSTCCGADIPNYPDSDICRDCKEHTGAEPEEDELDSLLKWAMIQSRIRQEQRLAKERVWTEAGLTKLSYAELERKAYSEMLDADVIETEYGTVQKVYGNGKIDFKPMSSMTGAENKRKSLILIQPEKP